MTDEDITDEQQLHSKVLGLVDSTGGTVNGIHQSLQSAQENGILIESHKDRATDIDAHLDLAMSEVDSRNPDADTVYTNVRAARAAATTFRRGLTAELEGFEPAEYADIGVYDTLGEYARHVEQTMNALVEYAEAWKQAQG